MLKILIVEDEKPISDLIKLCLKKAGYSCFCAYDGNTAADMINTTVYDLILLDIMLPNINGFELLEFIRPLNIPVIFLTAKDSVSDKVKGLRMGAEDYIVKPFEVAELLARVKEEGITIPKRTCDTFCSFQITLSYFSLNTFSTLLNKSSGKNGFFT